MPEHITLKSLEKKLTLFKKMYNAIRIVDPIHKKVVEYSKCERKETNEKCFDYWNNDHICDNCISIRAHFSNKSFMKLEQKPDSIMVVTALPIETAKEPMVLELLKDATETMMISLGDSNDGYLMKDIISTLNDVVVKDQLTGLYNRRYVEDRLPADIVKTIIEKKPLSIAFIDVDNLKEINDTYGHIAGDIALQNVGYILQCSIGANMGWVARYGGDEFIICMINTDINTAVYFAERLRKDIENTEVTINTGNCNVKITVSIGMHEVNDIQQATAKEAIDMADKNMYEAKRKGKNMIIGNKGGARIYA